MKPFELTAVGGPWQKRLAPRRAWLDELPWDEQLPKDVLAARVVWTRTAFSEYASAAAFAEIATASLHAAAPIDLIAAAGDFVIDELLHAELAGRIAIALGGAVPLEVDYAKLVRPPASDKPLVRAAELIVRTSCVGESLTVPILKLSRSLAGSGLIASAINRIVSDESMHAQFGWWFLDWADEQLTDDDRAHLARVAADAIRAFAPLLDGQCATSGLGVVACDRYDPTFLAAVDEQVAKPLAERGIEIPRDAITFA